MAAEFAQSETLAPAGLCASKIFQISATGGIHARRGSA